MTSAVLSWINLDRSNLKKNKERKKKRKDQKKTLQAKKNSPVSPASVPSFTPSNRTILRH
jgi:hypothetical protein